MKHKTRLNRFNTKIDQANQNTRENGTNPKSEKEYHKLLAKVYEYESQTLFKRENTKTHIKD